MEMDIKEEIKKHQDKEMVGETNEDHYILCQLTLYNCNDRIFLLNIMCLNSEMSSCHAEKPLYQFIRKCID